MSAETPFIAKAVSKTVSRSASGATGWGPASASCTAPSMATDSCSQLLTTANRERGARGLGRHSRLWTPAAEALLRSCNGKSIWNSEAIAASALVRGRTCQIGIGRGLHALGRRSQKMSIRRANRMRTEAKESTPQASKTCWIAAVALSLYVGQGKASARSSPWRHGCPEATACINPRGTIHGRPAQVSSPSLRRRDPFRPWFDGRRSGLPVWPGAPALHLPMRHRNPGRPRGRSALPSPPPALDE
eukprot:scaffold361_cov248-Pinguiococcus_pyrenoidosus.AAC.35